MKYKNTPPNKEIKTSYFFKMFILIISLIILISLLVIYFLNLNTLKPSNKINVIVEKPNKIELKNKNFTELKQFYPNMKFNHNQISYEIDTNCKGNKRQNIVKAFDILSNKVKLINFYPVLSNPDIEVNCSEIKEHKSKIKENSFIAGEGGAKEIIKTGKHNIITKGVILLYKYPYKAIECNWPNIELHELIHVFGFKHSKNKNSLMYPYLESCSQKLDDSIIKQLKKLYSEKNLVDLYIENVSITTERNIFATYLNFNITIKNSGVVNSQNINLSVLDNEELVNNFELEALKYGGGIFLNIENLKLIHKNPKNVKFIIDKENLIKESDKENNVIKIEFN